MIARKFEAKVFRSDDEVVDVPVLIELAYDADNDPLAVAMTISSPYDMDDEVTWTFGRDLLKRGCSSIMKVGDGDVRFRTIGKRWPDSGLVICLKNAFGHADLGLPHHEVTEFLRDTAEQAASFEATGGCMSDRIDDFLKEVLG